MSMEDAAQRIGCMGVRGRAAAGAGGFEGSVSASERIEGCEGWGMVRMVRREVSLCLDMGCKSSRVCSSVARGYFVFGQLSVWTVTCAAVSYSLSV